MMTETMIIAPFTAELEAYLKNTNMDYEMADENKLFIYTSDYIAPDHKAVDPLIAELVKYINEDCIIEGYYDHGGNSGSAMKFRFEYLNSNLKKYLSDWLDFLPVDSFADYEEFCEEYEDRFSEEEYSTHKSSPVHSHSSDQKQRKDSAYRKWQGCHPWLSEVYQSCGSILNFV